MAHHESRMRTVHPRYCKKYSNELLLECAGQESGQP